MLGIGGGILVWWALAEWVFPPLLFASPWVTLEALFETIASGELLESIAVSLARILAGYLLGASIAIPLGLAMGSVPFIRRLSEPYVEVFRFIPAIAFLPLAILWFGIGETSKVFLICYSTIFIVLINTIAGVFAVNPVKIRAAKCLGIDGFALFRFVILPSTVPYIATGMRIGMGAAFMTVVAAEMLAAESGIGYMIFSSRVYYQTGRMFVGLTVLGVLGFLTDRVFRAITARFLGRYGVRYETIRR